MPWADVQVPTLLAGHSALADSELHLPLLAERELVSMRTHARLSAAQAWERIQLRKDLSRGRLRARAAQHAMEGSSPRSPLRVTQASRVSLHLCLSWHKDASLCCKAPVHDVMGLQLRLFMLHLLLL